MSHQHIITQQKPLTNHPQIPRFPDTKTQTKCYLSAGVVEQFDAREASGLHSVGAHHLCQHAATSAPRLVRCNFTPKFEQPPTFSENNNNHTHQYKHNNTLYIMLYHHHISSLLLYYLTLSTSYRVQPCSFCAPTLCFICTSEHRKVCSAPYTVVIQSSDHQFRNDVGNM